MKENDAGYELGFEEFMNLISCSVFVIKDSIIIDCNEPLLKMFGYETKDEVIGLEFHELAPDHQQDGSLSITKLENIFKKLSDVHQYLEFQWTNKRKNGELFLTNMGVVENKGVVYIIIKNRKGEKKSEQNQNVVNDIFKKHKSVMMLIEPATGNIVEVNQAAIQYYGYTKDELLAMQIQDINILNEEQVKEEMSRAKTEKRNYFEFIHRLANGEMREVEVHSFPIEAWGRILLLSTIYDISEKLKQELMFDTLFFDSPYAVAILDKEQKIVNINRNFAAFFQYSLQEAKGEYLHQLISSRENRTQMDHNIELIYQGKVVKQEGIRKRQDGKFIEVEILGYPVVKHQQVIGVYIMYIDITYKKAYEKELLLFRKVLENNSEGVVITDREGRIEWINKAFHTITGYSLSEISGERMSILKSGIHDQAFYKEMWDELSEKGKWSGEIWDKSKKDDIFAQWVTINSIHVDSDQATHYVGIVKDLSEKKKLDRRMSDLQQKDSLTGLYNRSYFLERIDSFITDGEKAKNGLSIIFIDIADFKEINSSLGYLVGDKLLIELSERLQPLINKMDVLSRFSGDEFAVLCKSLTKEEVKFFAKKVLRHIKLPFRVENTILYINANIGISRFPDDGIDAESLVRFADIAMHKAKGQVKDKICFYSKEMSKEMEDKFFIANHLVGAISNNELQIYYQPIFDIHGDGNIVGAEALLRWKNPALGMVPPDKFIPLVERTGQIVYIGAWVLDQVCKQIYFWKCAGYHAIPISVNISVKQLEQIGFAQAVMESIIKNNIQFDNIELEITESVSSGNLIPIIKNLKELKKQGIKISMDDFGTGFSSLGQLDLFELDKLKIDKIFIDDLVTVPKRQNLVKTIIAMAKNLDLMVVAEGIETEDQLNYLKELGCQLGQGYLFSRPLPVDEIEALLNADKT